MPLSINVAGLDCTTQPPVTTTGIAAAAAGSTRNSWPAFCCNFRIILCEDNNDAASVGIGLNSTTTRRHPGGDTPAIHFHYCLGRGLWAGWSFARSGGRGLRTFNETGFRLNCRTPRIVSIEREYSGLANEYEQIWPGDNFPRDNSVADSRGLYYYYYDRHKEWPQSAKTWPEECAKLNCCAVS